MVANDLYCLITLNNNKIQLSKIDEGHLRFIYP